MNPFFRVRTFTRRYFPRLIAVILLTTASFSFATLSVMYSFFHNHPYENEYAVGSVVTAAFLLSFGSYILIRGRVWGVWVIVGLLLACLLAVISTVERTPHKLFSVFSLLVPLSALLVINSRRFRQMCKRVVVIRKMRNRCVAGGGNE
ncbi:MULTISPECIES: hypothetical protein [Pseudomonas]|uniref:Uncharacterized protein n=1 Tax=Pseudomonas donghuensis TaxID=1163398 RepID=A0AAQ0DMM6_9PSED|nr:MULTISPECIES: hypothetical protein [Pseudomonas]MDF9894260.1 glucan phosphoethanolaminetransferase (alkaline phosphatase superfamily) [Pseudomonas vranovensis]MCP6692168.1 hypothetical protein [Pseudomonas donghuensis]MCP6698085.1 hypothetical protein [Pseudomonas donghuensis]QWE81339.1 hypothetical protein BV82_17330 [Pseudomonas donghuensis]WSE81582.1 hypothetical protein VP780_16940 [Pseudomonas donghuensis]